MFLRSRRARLFRILTPAAFVLLALCLAPAAHAKRTLAQKKQAAQVQYTKALKVREALQGKPADSRRRLDYDRVIDAFRRVYYIAPTSNKADESVQAVAEVMAEYGRAFKDKKSFRNAIAQYEFLRREYPGSRYRFEALFTIGQIYREDLGDEAKAKGAFDEFLKRYPRHSLADQAKSALAEMEDEAKAAKSRKAAPRSRKEVAAAEPAAKSPRVEVAAEVPASTDQLPLVTSIRHWSTPDYTRVAIDLEQEVKYEAGRVPAPDRIYFDLHDTKLASELVGKSFEVGDGFLRKIRVAQFNSSLTRVVLEVDEVAEYSAFLLPNPYRLIIDVHGKQEKQTMMAADTTTPKASAPEPRSSAAAKAESRTKQDVAAEDLAEAKPDATKELTVASSVTNQELNRKKVRATSEPTSSPTFESVAPRAKGKGNKQTAKKEAEEPPVTIREAQPTSSGERSLIRALGLKVGRIVVDAGHGGHDTGTIGPKGLMEKDLVLDVALRLGKLLETKLSAEVIYTRNDDTFIPLESRTAIANQHEADLFISVHANSSRDPSARGVETYYLNFTSDAEALDVAARENAVSQKSVFELQDLVKKIALKEKIEESREFAGDVQKALHTGLSTRSSAMRDRGVKKAPFVVLIGANMPSILAEISFVSNPGDERRLKTPEHRQKIADSLFKGISRYASGLSSVRVARNSAESTGP